MSSPKLLLLVGKHTRHIHKHQKQKQFGPFPILFNIMLEETANAVR